MSGQIYIQCGGHEVQVWDLHLREASRSEARLRLKEILGKLLSLDPDSVKILRTESGKPFLSVDQNSQVFEFSLSHSLDRALVGVGKGVRVGVDIEVRQERKQWTAIIERVFAESEKNEIAKLPEKMQLDTFWKFWTAKEAILKAHGGVLMKHVSQIVLGLDLSIQSLPLEFGPSVLTHVQEVNLGPDVIAMVAVTSVAARSS